MELVATHAPTRAPAAPQALPGGSDDLGVRAFPMLARLAARVCGAPVALLCAGEGAEPWFEAAHGLDPGACARGDLAAFVAHAMRSPDRLTVVPDVLADARLRGNPLVAGSLRVRFFAGKPLRGPDGRPAGVLCVIDRAPRPLTLAQRGSLIELAGLAEELISARDGTPAIARLHREVERLAGIDSRARAPRSPERLRPPVLADGCEVHPTVLLGV